MAKGLINKFKERLYDLMPQLLDSVDQQAENILNVNVVTSVKHVAHINRNSLP